MFRKLLKKKEWQPEWKDRLADTLQELQQDTDLRFVLVVAEESDLYTELLYFFSFLGLLFASTLAYCLQNLSFAKDYASMFPELWALPLIGYTAGSLLHFFRAYFLRGTFRQLAHKKVSARAQNYFLEHIQEEDPQPLSLLYFSARESRAVLVNSQSVEKIAPKGAIKQILRNLEKSYSPSNPSKSLIEATKLLVETLKKHIPHSEGNSNSKSRILLVQASDHDRSFVPILDGGDGVN